MLTRIQAQPNASALALLDRLDEHLASHPEAVLPLYEAGNETFFEQLKQGSNLLATYPQDGRLLSPFNSLSYIWNLEDKYPGRVVRLPASASTDFSQTPLALLVYRLAPRRLVQASQSSSSGQKLVQMSPHAFLGLLMTVVFILTVVLGVYLLGDIKTPSYFARTLVPVGKES